MHRTMCALSIGIVSAWIFAAGASGGVIVVDAANGPGAQFTTLQPAIDAAANGDTLLIRAGTYVPASIDGKGLTLVGDGLVEVKANPWASILFYVSNVGAQDRVVIRGIRFVGTVGNGVGFSTNGIWADSVDGLLWIDSCFLSGGLNKAGLVLNACSNVVVTHCELRGDNGNSFLVGHFFSVYPPSSGLSATASNVTVHGSSFVGGNGIGASISIPFGGHGPTAGAPGAKITGGSARFFNCALTGGKGGNGDDEPGYYCLSPLPGGSALVLDTGDPDVVLVKPTLVAGATGAVVGACPAPPPAPITNVVSGTLTVLDGDPGDFTATSPVREGQTATLTTTSAPSASIFLLLAADPANVSVPQYIGALHVGVSTIVVAAGAVPASGVASMPFVVPNLPPAILGVSVFAQAATCPPTAPCALTAPAMIEVLDSSL